jgi:hypothetical protein
MYKHGAHMSARKHADTDSHPILKMAFCIFANVTSLILTIPSMLSKTCHPRVDGCVYSLLFSSLGCAQAQSIPALYPLHSCWLIVGICQAELWLEDGILHDWLNEWAHSEQTSKRRVVVTPGVGEDAIPLSSEVMDSLRACLTEECSGAIEVV